MDLKTRRRIETKEGVVCDVHLFNCTTRHEILAMLRLALGTMIADAEAHSLQELILFLDLTPETLDVVGLETLLKTITETLELSCYSARKPENDAELEVRLLLPNAIINSVEASCIADSLKEGTRNGQSLNYARWLGDLPPNVLDPQSFATMIEERLSQMGQVTTLNDRELETQGFGGIIAVGQGSKNKPRFVIFEAGPDKPEKTIVIVGKGMTFDTGGYSIKGKQHHNEMKYDMCGAANVVSALEILVPLLPQVRFVGLLPLAENMVSADAQRPGDVYRAHNGKWIEVYNTDAEGRLILGDALSFAAQFNPDAIIDIATLTGGTTHIAGNMAGILCTNEERVLPILKKACLEAGERFIHLEVLDEALEDLKSDVADLTNMHNRWSSGAPTMYAAAFLKQFVPTNTLWIHLDIANVAWSGRPSAYLRNRGATSYGARSMVNMVKALCH